MDEDEQRCGAAGRSLPRAIAEVTIKELLPFLLIEEDGGDNSNSSEGEPRLPTHASLILNELESLAKQFTRDAKEKVELYERRCLPVFERDVPAPVRKKSRELLEETTAAMTATAFAEEMERSTRRLLRRFSSEDGDGDDGDTSDDGREDCSGLNSDRDTEEELENIVRIFPEVLEDYPEIFRCEANDLAGAAFIPRVAQLRKEFSYGEGESRGGLMTLVGGKNVLEQLATRISPGVAPGHEERDDELSASVLRRLRETGLLRKGDIEEHELLHQACVNSYKYFPERRFRFFSSWDPDALARPDSEGCLPLHYAAEYSTSRDFQTVLEEGIRRFPERRGVCFLFRNVEDAHPCTPFSVACECFGRAEALKAAENALAKCSDEPLVNTAAATVLAAVDDAVSLDGVYFLLRRQPDTLQKLLSGKNNNSDVNNGGGKKRGGDIATTATAGSKRKRNQKEDAQRDH